MISERMTHPQTNPRVTRPAFTEEKLMPDKYETSAQRCPECRKIFHTLADEVGTHACPYCGYEPYEGIDVDEDEEE